MKKTITFDVSAEEVKEILAEWFGVKPDNVEAYTECRVEKEFEFPEKTITCPGTAIHIGDYNRSTHTNPEKNGLITLTLSPEGGIIANSSATKNGDNPKSNTGGDQ